MKIDLTKIYKKYKGLWVVLDKKLRVVVVAEKNAKIAYKKALEQGENQPILFKVPQENMPYFGSFSAK